MDLRELATGTGGADAGTDTGDGLAFAVPTLGGVPGFDEVRECRKPIIAAVDGWCLAGGFELALSCDIRVATRAAVFGLPEARRGMLPGPGLHELPRLMPYGEALALLLTGSTLGAPRAVAVGLVQRLAEDRDELFRIADDLAGEIVACAPLAVEATKQIVRSTRGLPVADAWTAAEPAVRRVAASDDAREGPRAFVEKRAPRWTGH
jgi:enoyl-CoA hydratase/carnithine racemase